MDGLVIEFPGHKHPGVPAQVRLPSGRTVHEGPTAEIDRCRRIARLYDEIGDLLEAEMEG